MHLIRVAVLDDWQKAAHRSADWSELEKRAELRFFHKPLGDSESTIAALKEFEILIAMRERTPLTASVISRLPALRMIALTGVFSGTLDFAACTRQGIVVCNTGSDRTNATTAEMAFALLLAAARQLPASDRAVRKGHFQEGIASGMLLEGRTLGIVGLGKIGSRVARIGNALGMRVVAWSPNMTAARAHECGALAVDKDHLFAVSDAVSLHLMLSERTRDVIGAAELRRMKRGAILVNTARAGLIDEPALVECVRSGQITAALDVYWQEPAPAGHPLLMLPNVVLAPHLGYCTDEVYAQFYAESVENVMAFLNGTPSRVMNPEALAVHS
jgi:phosphoglycerate dehydrogenase-like enzyme